jgi:hypothetical protein
MAGKRGMWAVRAEEIHPPPPQGEVSAKPTEGVR